MTVIETVTFSLAQGTTRAGFLDANAPMKDFLNECAGFLSRRLSEGDDGTWQDHVEWRDMQSAKAASQKLMTSDTMKPFLAAIDPASVDMRHRHVRLAIE